MMVKRSIRGLPVREYHGATSTPEYQAWKSMKTRATNANRAQAKDYVLRGITVCPRWSESFSAFLEDVGKRPSALHTLDRINNELGYEHGNVKWATRGEQNRNTRRNIRLTREGRTMTAAEWARELGISPYTIYDRIARGNDWVSTPPRAVRCHRGHEYTEENTRVMERGERVCRQCRREDARKARAHKREAKAKP